MKIIKQKYKGQRSQSTVIIFIKHSKIYLKIPTYTGMIHLFKMKLLNPHPSHTRPIAKSNSYSKRPYSSSFENFFTANLF